MLMPILSFGQLNLKLGMGETYGSYCGIAGQHPPTRILLEDLIKENKLDILDEWIHSTNAVRQVYAIEAFIRMDFVTDERKARINELIDSEQEISTCRGCVYSNKTVGEIISKLLEEQS